MGSCKGRGFTASPMDRPTKGSSERTRDMEEGFISLLLGPTTVVTRGIKRRERELSLGLTGKSSKGTSTMGSQMDKGLLPCSMVLQSMGSGSMGSWIRTH